MDSFDECFSINTENEKVLKVRLQKEITVYLNYSLLLCLILWDEKKIPWLYEHFANIYSMNEDNGYWWLDFAEELLYPMNVTDFFYIDSNAMKDITDVVAFIKDKISNGYYIIFFLDEYYLSGKQFYKKKHPTEQVLLYGYNDEKKIFQTIGFSDEHILDFIQHTYDEIADAFKMYESLNENSAIYVKLYAATLFKPKDFQKEYQINIKRIAEEIRKYISSFNDPAMLRPDIRIQRGTKAVFGIQVYEELLRHLDNLLNDKYTMDYRFIHLLSEHKKIMNKRMAYIADKYHNNLKLKELSVEYDFVDKQFEAIRITYLKHVYLDNLGNEKAVINGRLKNKEVIKRIIQDVTDVKTREVGVLKDFYNELLLLNG